MKVNRIEDKKAQGYGLIYDVALPTRFYFEKDGSFDGIEVSVENATEREKQIIEELCVKLAIATGIKYKYTIEEEKDDEG